MQALANQQHQSSDSTCAVDVGQIHAKLRVQAKAVQVARGGVPLPSSPNAHAMVGVAASKADEWVLRKLRNLTKLPGRSGVMARKGLCLGPYLWCPPVVCEFLLGSGLHFCVCCCRLPGSKVCIYARWQEDGPWLLNAAEAKDCTPLQRTSADKMKLCRPCKSHLASVGNFGSLSDGGAFVTFVTKARRRR